MDPEGVERFEEGIDSEYHDVVEELTNQDSPDQRRIADSSHGVVVVHHYVSVWSCWTTISVIPLLPATLGSQTRKTPTCHRL